MDRLYFYGLNALLFGCYLLVGSTAYAGLLSETLFDPVDGQLDLTNHLNSQYGFMPVPIIITEPAVGYGGGVALVYLHDRLGGEPAPKEAEKKKGRKGPPSISALAGGATENGTWFVGGGHFGSWHDDSMRYTGVLAQASVTMDYYSLGAVLQNPVEFQTDALYTSHELVFRLGATSFFLGGKYTYVDTDNKFNFGVTLPVEVPSHEFSDRQAGLAVVLTYDSRDNLFTPNKGLDVDVRLTKYAENLGGNDDFANYLAKLRYYQPLSSKLVLGVRLEGEMIDGGEAPFYMYPFIKMRGIKAMQYQGEKVVLGELELRWNFYERWSAVGFAGVGEAKGKFESEDAFAKGIGFRYFLAKGYGMHMGVDVAQGPDDTAIYIQFGGAWH